MKTIILFAIIFLASCGQKVEPPVLPVPAITAFRVEEKTIPAIFEFVGVAKSSHPVEIRARVEGYIWSIDYVEGSAVEIDQKLFQLDPRTYEAAVEQAAAELERQEAILWRARRSLDRIEPLYKKNAVSQRDLDDATAAVLAAEADVLAAEANLVQAKLNLSYTVVTSPIKGLSGRAVYREGSLITPNVNGLLTLVSIIDPIWILFSVSDNQLLQGLGEKARNEIILPTAQEYTVELELADGSKFPYKGVVNFTSPTLDPDTGALIVRSEFPNPEKLILPGQFVKAYVSGAMRPHAICVPQKAVLQGQNGPYVFVVDSKTGTATLRSVELGDWYNEYWIIKQGLKDGELVVSDGINKITPGAGVHIVSIDTMRIEP